MLTADGPSIATLPVSPGRSMGPATTVSVLLHGALVALLLIRLIPSRPAPAMQPIEVELVQQQAQTVGAPAQATPSAPQSAAQPSPTAQTGGDAPNAASRPAPPSPSGPAVNLGNGPEDVDPLTVTGDNIKPPEPDARYHNMPPHYPADAAKVGAQGTVQLRIHISPAGVPLDAIVTGSSGTASLDAEARRAVMRWHFRPALSGGRAVPFDYEINIRFALGDR